MILTIISPGHARLILRVYFIVMMAGIAWLAEKVLQSRAKLQVIRTRSVPVHRVLGWMQGFDLIKAVWSLRQLPGGKIGYLAMVIIFALSKLADLITTTLVQQVSVQSRCAFGEGLVFNTTGQPLFTYPPVNGAPYIVVHNSQYFSLNNSCTYGIYNKVNRDTSFCAENQDIVGTWECTNGNIISYPAGYSLDAIVSDFQNRNLLYANFSASYTEFGSYYGHFAIWGNSAPSDVPGTSWEVRAAIQTNASPYDTVTMLPLSCSMSAPEAETALQSMQPWTTMQVWKMAFQGLMYYGTGTPVVVDPEAELAMLLNTMVMVQGGNNILLSVPALGEDQTQGCIAPATKIPFVVEALVLVVVGCAFGLLLLFVVYSLIIWSKDRVMKDATKHFPDNVVGWAALAAKEHQISKEQNYSGRVRQRELKNWVVGLDLVRGQRKLRVMPQNSVREEFPLQNRGYGPERGLLS
jgi:hypothetical protein